MKYAAVIAAVALLLIGAGIAAQGWAAVDERRDPTPIETKRTDKNCDEGWEGSSRCP